LRSTAGWEGGQSGEYAHGFMVCPVFRLKPDYVDSSAVATCSQWKAGQAVTGGSPAPDASYGTLAPSLADPSPACDRVPYEASGRAREPGRVPNHRDCAYHAAKWLMLFLVHSSTHDAGRHNAQCSTSTCRDTNLLVWGVDLVEEHLLAFAGIPTRPLVARRPLKQMAEYSINAKVQLLVVLDLKPAAVVQTASAHVFCHYWHCASLWLWPSLGCYLCR
jgi:hypothetical protein